MKLDQVSIGKISHFISKHSGSAPVVVEEDFGKIRVVNYTIEHKNNWIVKTAGKRIASFKYRSWATAYAVALSTKNNVMAEFIKSSETRLQKLITDRFLYSYHKDVAIKQHDFTKQSIIESRISRTDYDLAALLEDTQQVLLYQQFV